MKKLVMLALFALLASGCSSKGTTKPEAAGSTPSLSGGASAEGGTGAGGTGGEGGTGKAGGEGVPADRVVYFDFDKSEIRPDTRAVLEQHSAYLNAHPTNIRLEGHADERGSREYNLALGEKRADSVKRTFTILGVPDSLMTTLSYGEERPIDKGHNEAAWQLNRRVEIIYTQ